MSKNKSNKAAPVTNAGQSIEILGKFTATKSVDGVVVRSLPIEAKSFEDAMQIAEQRFVGE